MTTDNSAEKTEVYHDPENAVRITLKGQSRAKTRHDTCCDSNGPSTIISTEPVRNGLIEMKRRGVKVRIITEITKDNLPYCKQLMPIVSELRHLDSIKGNFGVTDNEYGGVGTIEEGKPVMEMIHSNVKSFVEQQQYFFEILWSKAIPSEERIREIEEGGIRYETKIIHEPEEILKQMKRKNCESYELCVCTSAGALQFSYNYLFDTYLYLLDKERKGEGRGIRFITNINKENIDLVKKFIDIGVKLRHCKNLPPMSFGVSEKELHMTMEKLEGGKTIQRLLGSTEPLYVKGFQNIFEELWNSGIDARERIRAIEEGVDTEGIQIIQNPTEVQKLGWELIKSSTDEILIIFSTANAFLRQARVGAIRLLEETAEHGVRIRILTPRHDLIDEIAQKLKELQIETRYIESSLETKVTILVVDSKFSLVAELKDDTKETSIEAIGLSMYSNSKATVSSYASMFESLWTQTELYEQLKVHDTMQRDFINVAAHELRTPIQPIISSAELLDSKLIYPEQHELLDVMQRNAKRLHRLVESILDVTKIESRSLQLKKNDLI